MNPFPFPAVLLLAAALSILPAALAAPSQSPTMPATDAPPVRFTVAQFNARLYSNEAGGVLRRLQGGQDVEARKVAAIIQRVRPDLLLINEFDFDAEGALADVFQGEYLAVGQHGEAAIHYPYRFLAPVNTGVPSGMDLNGDGRIGGEGRLHGEDSFGFGLQAGQYGMLVLSRFPIESAGVRTFQYLRWADLPGARRPSHPDGRWWHDDTVWPRLRLSSKSHWDVPVRLPDGIVHFLASHPTPPVFDGPEDRNGRRNADELALWEHYLDNREADWLCDDQGRCGGLAEGARFVLAGDLNNDPVDGNGLREAIQALIKHPRVLPHAFPRSEGAVLAARSSGGIHAQHRGDPAHDTGAFGPRTGNLQLDYVLPSLGFRVLDSGVFWPPPGQPGAEWIDASDHRMIWLRLETVSP